MNNRRRLQNAKGMKNKGLATKREELFGNLAAHAKPSPSGRHEGHGAITHGLNLDVMTGDRTRRGKAEFLQSQAFPRLDLTALHTHHGRSVR